MGILGIIQPHFKKNPARHCEERSNRSAAELNEVNPEYAYSIFDLELLSLQFKNRKKI
jgi:hypothetical protein